MFTWKMAVNGKMVVHFCYVRFCVWAEVNVSEITYFLRQVGCQCLCQSVIELSIIQGFMCA